MAPSKEMTLRSDMTVSKVNPDQTLKASKALLAHMKKAAKETVDKASKKDLLAGSDDEEEAAAEEPIWLTLTTKRHISDSRSLKPGKIALPHSLNTDPNLAVCLITAEPQRAFKNLVASESFPADLRKKITRVIDFNKLKAKFKTFETQRALFAEHDVFLGDSRIINRLPATLGKTFYKSTAKRPIPVTIHAPRPSENGKRVPKQAKNAEENPGNACTAPQLAAEITKALSSALVNLSPTTNTAVRVGLGSFTAEQVAANIDAVAGALVGKFVPGKWNNVRGIYVKGPASAALPIWLTEELWVDAEKDIVADGSDEAKALEAAASADGNKKKNEKANIGKKRKASEDDDEEASAAAGTKGKKSKKSEVEGKLLPEVKTAGGKGKGKGKGAISSNNVAASEDNLDKEIAERKASLKKQKKAAKKAIDA